MILHRSIDEPIRLNAPWEERWKGSDRGLIACWERGREKSQEDVAIASRAREGQLVLLPWKGGVEKATKAKKYGSLFYLAMWQGLRANSLSIDTDEGAELTCTATKMTVAFTSDISKYSEE